MLYYGIEGDHVFRGIFNGNFPTEGDSTMPVSPRDEVQERYRNCTGKAKNLG
jgi:hypothetical protein